MLQTEIRIFIRVDLELKGSGLTRIRPKKCAFKGVIFGSNPLEFDSDTIKIGVTTEILLGAGTLNNPKLLDPCMPASPKAR